MAYQNNELLLKNGIQSILQAFELQCVNFNQEKEKYEKNIFSLESTNTLLKEENDSLKSNNNLISKDNVQLKSRIEALLSSIQTKQNKIKLIKKTLIEETQSFTEKDKRLACFIQNDLPQPKHSSSSSRGCISNAANETYILSFKRGTDTNTNSNCNSISCSHSKFDLGGDNSIQQPRRINLKKVSHLIPQKDIKKPNSNDRAEYSNEGNNTDRIRYNNTCSKLSKIRKKFLTECKVTLPPKQFEQLALLCSDITEGNQIDVSNQIRLIIQNSPQLLNLFDLILHFKLNNTNYIFK